MERHQHLEDSLHSFSYVSITARIVGCDHIERAYWQFHLSVTGAIAQHRTFIRVPQLPDGLPVPGELQPTPHACPACGPSMADIFVDGCLKLKHCAYAEGSATLVANELFVSDEEVRIFDRAADVRRRSRKPALHVAPLTNCWACFLGAIRSGRSCPSRTHHSARR